jgi:hypothetical protein
MKLTDAIELHALLAADSNYLNPTIWITGNGCTVEAIRKTDRAEIIAKVSEGNLIVEVQN